MNVWIVNPFDNLPSEGNRPQRYWLMSEAFVRAGHRVTYWTSNFSHATKKKRRSRNEVEVDSGIEVIQMPTLPYGRNVCWARARSHRKIARDFETLAKVKVRGEGEQRSCSPAIIIASTPPLGLCAAAMRVARSCGAKFVCDIQDAWPETFERVLPRFVWTAIGMRRTARRIYREADAVSAVAKRYLELAKGYGSCKPMRVFGHAIEKGKVEGEGGGGEGFNTEAQRHRGDIFKLVYAGNMSLSYDLETVIKAVRGVPNVTLDIAGNGPDLERLKKLSISSTPLHGQNNIRFHGYLGERELSDLLRRCDVGIVPMFPESCVGVPGKLADYAAAGLRVIESLGGECQEIVERYHAGVHYAAGDISSFKQAVSRLTSLSPSPAFADAFDARTIMDAYVAWCGEVLA